MRISARHSATGACTPARSSNCPILGPSDLRDAPSKVVDTYTNPRSTSRITYVKYGLYLPYLVDRRASLLPLDDTLKNVYDPYAFIRDAYLAHRAYLVSNGKVTEEPLVDPDADMPDSACAAPSPGAAPGPPRRAEQPPHRATARAEHTAAAPPPAASAPRRASGHDGQPAVSNSSTSLKRAS